jgi:hypothetical protein
MNDAGKVQALVKRASLRSSRALRHENILGRTVKERPVAARIARLCLIFAAPFEKAAMLSTDTYSSPRLHGEPPLVLMRLLLPFLAFDFSQTKSPRVHVPSIKHKASFNPDQHSFGMQRKRF